MRRPLSISCAIMQRRSLHSAHSPALISDMNRARLHSWDRRDIACPLPAPNAIFDVFRSARRFEFGEFFGIHLDPLGGLSGDMFVAALLDAFPEHWPHVQSTIASLNLGAGAECELALASRSFLRRTSISCRSGSHGAEPFREPATARSPQRVFAQSRGKPPSRARSLSRESKRPQGVVRHSSRTRPLRPR